MNKTERITYALNMRAPGGRYKDRFIAISNHCTATHYDSMPMQYLTIFDGCTNNNFQMKKVDIFLIFAPNIDRGYTLEPPQ